MSLLSDDLIRQLVAVGQVDLLVGVPTWNNAATVADVVKAVRTGMLTHLPRARTLLLNSDGGSQDDTRGIVQQASDDGGTVTASHGLRTAHRIVTPYSGPPGKASALRLIFAAADLLQAGAVAIVDPDVTSVTPEWVPALVAPIRRGEAEFTLPVFSRHPLESPLLTQLVRPLMGAILCRLVREPLSGEFACSGRFAASLVEQEAWDTPLIQGGVDVWILANALASDIRVSQAALGPRLVNPRRPMPPRAELFQQVVGTVFACLDRYAPAWLERQGTETIRIDGDEGLALPGAPPPDLSRMSEAFTENVRDLYPVLGEILRPELLAGIVAAAGEAGAPAQYGDELWASTVSEFLIAYHRAVMTREHIIQALLPLYLGRTTAFLLQHGESEPQAAEAALEHLFTAFERARAAVVAGWAQTP